ncbi:MAG TPA: MauE/DoxX family redox-associated membrane protein [Pyrinomonadaceae bacterium]|nr:MauE/DoxX family redox-associated membrane protein [Pyrinomonadaceae bacterium]
MDEFLLLIRLILAAIFALAGIGKFLDLDGSEKAVKDFDVPENLAKPFSVLLPAAEILIAILLLPAAASWFGAILGFLLLLVFIGAMLYQLARGNAPDCHCFGQIHSEPVGKKSLVRNAVIAFLAFVLVVRGRENQGAGIFDSPNGSSEGNFMTFIFGLATVGLLAAAVYFLKTISEQQTQIMRRIEILELISRDGGGRETERENLTNPNDGLPVGAPAPDFQLPDAGGRNISFENLLARAKPILFVFVSPTCNPCAALLPEIEAWQKDLNDKVNFVFISSGNSKDNLEKFAGGNLKQILLQKEKEISALFGARWTPTALFVNADGTIASGLAAGDKAIRELVEKIKAQNFDGESLFIGNGTRTKLGASLPEFFESDVFDKSVASNDFLGKKTLVAFWSATCPHCVNMLEDLRDWDKSKGANEPNLLVLSEGEAEAHRSLELQSPVVLDKGRKISNQLGMQGTPSAVLISEEGKVISETAIGAARIWDLLGKRK